MVADAAALASAAATEFARRAAEAIGRSGRFAVALSGGHTPRRAYELLAEPRGPAGDRLPWDRVHVFWGDERCVPPDHPDSNFRMAREALLDRVPIPPANLHRIRGEAASPDDAASGYEDDLRAFFSIAADAPPVFDLVFLGLGGDGHTASLFPGGPALAEARRLAVAAGGPPPATHRVTLTLPVLNSARAVVFLVSGGDKVSVLARILACSDPDPTLPASLVRPRDGELLWLADRAAADPVGSSPAAPRQPS